MKKTAPLCALAILTMSGLAACTPASVPVEASSASASVIPERQADATDATCTDDTGEPIERGQLSEDTATLYCSGVSLASVTSWGDVSGLTSLDLASAPAPGQNVDMGAFNALKDIAVEGDLDSGVVKATATIPSLETLVLSGPMDSDVRLDVSEALTTTVKRLTTFNVFPDIAGKKVQALDVSSSEEHTLDEVRYLGGLASEELTISIAGSRVDAEQVKAFSTPVLTRIDLVFETLVSDPTSFKIPEAPIKGVGFGKAELDNVERKKDGSGSIVEGEGGFLSYVSDENGWPEGSELTASFYVVPEQD